MAMAHVARDAEAVPVNLWPAPSSALVCLAKAVAARDGMTPGRALSSHEGSVAHLSMRLAEWVGWRDRDVELIGQAASVHDIGKLAMPDSILLHRGGLGPQEWAVLHTHPTIGAMILSGHQDLGLDLAAVIALNHHEAFDGSGYPNRLAGEQIPLAARIVAPCDVYDALRQDRPYKAGMGHGEVMTIMEHGDGRMTPAKFDPAVLGTFLANARQVERAWEERRMIDMAADGGERIAC